MTPSPRSRSTAGPLRFGRLGGAGYVVAILLVLGVALIASRNVFDSAGPLGGLAKLTLTLGLVLLGGAAVLLASSIWRVRSTRRDNYLASRFTATVLSSVRSKDLVAVIPELQEGGIIDHLVTLPMGLSLLVNGSGIEAWAGKPQSPRKLFAIEWADISAIVPSVTQELGRSSRGIAFIVRGVDRKIPVPFIITGAGFGKLFPLNSAKIALVVEDLESLRTRAIPAEDNGATRESR